MKKIYRYFFAAVAIASAASCAEQLDDNQAPAGQIPAEFAQMTISASLGEVTKTTYDNQNVLWEGTESITVFSKGSESSPAQFDMDWCSEDKAKASFTGLADLNAESYYAVYPHSATNACTSEGVLTVNIPAEQTAVAGGFASGANVAVAGFAKDNANVVFNNVSSLFSFGFETDADAILTKSVTVKVKKNAAEYYGIAGNVSVNYEADGDLVVLEGSAQSIVLNAPEGGFAKGETYYVAVAPVGTVAELELLYTHTDGTTTCERKNSNIVASLTRSTLVPLETIPVAYDDLPQEDFEVTIDFTQGWPLQPHIDDVQQTKLKAQAYTFTWESIQLQTGMVYGLSSDTGYALQDGALCFTGKSSNTLGFMKIPPIGGRYLRKLMFTIEGSFEGYSNTVKWLQLYSGFGDLDYTGGTPGTSNFPGSTTGYSLNNSSENGVPTYLTYTLPFTTTKGVTYGTNLGETFSVRSRTGNLPIQKVTMTYSKNITD